ncbi:MAG TPA: GNAT family N-acetyltransferase [Actinomycetota bacterium]|jgi:RimJ/RimL family protein N-acetyltransferase|nr:GNAT family N-acetyltransferase [Actinomycetota bacterium]
MSISSPSTSPNETIAVEGDLRIRRMRDEDADHERMVRWRNARHVREWWDPDEPPLTLEESRRHYGPRTGGGPEVACIVELKGRPIGYVQFYPWEEEPEAIEAIGLPTIPEAWGLDIFIGEPDLLDRGIGTRTVGLLCGSLFRDRGASAIMIVSAADNARALRAYEKAGFLRKARVLDTDTRGGERVESWLLVLERPSDAR